MRSHHATAKRSARILVIATPKMRWRMNRFWRQPWTISAAILPSIRTRMDLICRRAASTCPSSSIASRYGGRTCSSVPHSPVPPSSWKIQTHVPPTWFQPATTHSARQRRSSSLPQTRIGAKLFRHQQLVSGCARPTKTTPIAQRLKGHGPISARRGLPRKRPPKIIAWKTTMDRGRARQVSLGADEMPYGRNGRPNPQLGSHRTTTSTQSYAHPCSIGS